MSVLDEFRSIVNSPHQPAQNWKAETGGKVLGYLCTNLPEELIYAAGILPVRLLGSNEPETETRKYMFSGAFCTFARDCFAQALRGQYDYIDGLSYGYCCIHARQVFESWRRHMPVYFGYQFRVPNNLLNPHAKDFIVGEMEIFKQTLENWTGKSISVASIDKAIDIYNTSRRLMMSIYDLMKADNPPLTWTEVAEIALSGMLMDKEKFNQLLQKALDELSKRDGVAKNGPRLMIIGSVNNNFEVIKFVDSLAGHVVMDDYCTGSRYYQNEVIPEENRLAALAARMIAKPPCPLKDLPERRRPAHILKLAEDYKVQGVINTIQRLCDPHGLDYPILESTLQEKGIPMLKLELDLDFPVGQYRTRIEAFLEMIEVS